MSFSRHIFARTVRVSAFLVVSSVAALAGAALSGASDQTVTFKAKGPVGFKIEGTTHELTVSEDGGKVKVVVPLGGLQTGMELRDTHTKKALKVAEFPNAELVVSREALKFPSGDDSVDGDAKGKLTIAGTSKQTAFTYTAKKQGGGIVVDAKAKVSLKEFGVEVPDYGGITVKDDIELSIHFRATDR